MTPQLPPLTALRAFEATARHGSLSRAAAELHVTHGAISRHIRNLEQALGTPLFSRHGRGLILSPTGLRLREIASEAFDRLREGWSELQRQPQQSALVLGCSGSILARWIIPRLARIEADLPGLRLHLSASEYKPHTDLSGMDAVLLLDFPPWPTQWKVHELGAEWTGPVLSPQSPLASKLAGAAPEALYEEALLHPHSRPQAWTDWAISAGLQPERLQMSTGFDHLYYLLEAAVAGLGIAIAPQPLVADDLASGRLIAPWGFAQTNARWALCCSARNPDLRTSRLAAWLQQQLQH